MVALSFLLCTGFVWLWQSEVYFIALHGFLVVVASVVVEHGSRACGL